MSTCFRGLLLFSTQRMDDFELLRQHWDEIDDELQFKNDVGEPSSPSPPPSPSESSMITVTHYPPPAVERYLPMVRQYHCD
ncbi:hypothetical protein AC249_AIPGENE2015 [Exaiptasia diaphana]|nr:hypothetical protein AC249_AIPGENE2015 [Exaiptasia diaphana]